MVEKMDGSDFLEEKNYGLLKDLRVELKDSDKEENGAFCFGFWLYLTNFSSLPCGILHQEHPDITSSVPFLLLNEKKKMMLFPVLFLHKEASMFSSLNPLTEGPSVVTQFNFPMKKWLHVECVVSQSSLQLHINGEIVGEKHLTPVLNDELHTGGMKRKVLPCIIGDNHGFHGYVHCAKLSPSALPLKNYCIKDPPLQLAIDSSSASEIEEDSDGVWIIVGGKASCRRIFSLDVILLDAFGQPVNSEMEVLASLLYADNDEPVPETNDAEAPLLTTYDGIEYASSDRGSKLIGGRASFKLKMSQLSSKCDNKLFRIRFEIPKIGTYPFLEVFSPPIRCISRSRNARTSSVTLKKLPSGVYLLNGSQSPGPDDRSSELMHGVVCEAKPSPSSKRVKLGQEKPFETFNDSFTSQRAVKECKFDAFTTAEDNITYGSNLARRPENHDGSDNFSSDLETSETTKSYLMSVPSNNNQLSDTVVFKYCLGGLSERAVLLKEIALSVREEEIAKFAEQVSLFSGCSHHRKQIMMAKRLIEEGAEAWNLISQNNHHVLWENLVSGVKEHFLKIVSCGTRSLTHQDLDLLRRISGCQELVSQENFEKMWFWLYPVAFTLSQDQINSLWSSVSPNWIEGFITKEEAESSLQGPGGFREPGTFVLRFPTSRSWPHPDAGNLVITYIGSDYAIHHRLLSLDHLYSSKERTAKPLQDMLLEEPELSRLGSIERAH
ncbi:hypothetical protein ACH5RR_037502 [Cinchona calisaya]|uniref:SH2 domain-containing protein n=1 Tax=Cinchona calisaya TaxID=153742 RepID=A0ABD2Y6D6_9GENT